MNRVIKMEISDSKLITVEHLELMAVLLYMSLSEGDIEWLSRMYRQ